MSMRKPAIALTLVAAVAMALFLAFQAGLAVARAEATKALLGPSSYTWEEIESH